MFNFVITPIFLRCLKFRSWFQQFQVSKGFLICLFRFFCIVRALLCILDFLLVVDMDFESSLLVLREKNTFLISPPLYWELLCWWLDAALIFVDYDLKILDSDGRALHQLWILSGNVEWNSNGKLFEPDGIAMVLQLVPPWFLITCFSQIRSIAMRSPSLLSQCLAGLLSHDRTAAHSVNIVPDREPHLPSPAVEIVPSKVPFSPCLFIVFVLCFCTLGTYPDENKDYSLCINYRIHSSGFLYVGL